MGQTLCCGRAKGDPVLPRVDTVGKFLADDNPGGLTPFINGADDGNSQTASFVSGELQELPQSMISEPATVDEEHAAARVPQSSSATAVQETQFKSLPPQVQAPATSPVRWQSAPIRQGPLTLPVPVTTVGGYTAPYSVQGPPLYAYGSPVTTAVTTASPVVMSPPGSGSLMLRPAVGYRVSPPGSAGNLVMTSPPGSGTQVVYHTSGPKLPTGASF